MGLIEQLLLGTLLLGLCALVHVAILTLGIPLLIQMAAMLRTRPAFVSTAVLTLLGFGIIVFSHTIEIWLWAGTFVWLDTFPDMEVALYFSMVTYTTLGYGDIVPNPEIRLFASLSAVTGLLTFGLSTAFLVGLIGRILPGETIVKDIKRATRKEHFAE